MSEYQYAGILNKNKTMWQNKTECTEETIGAVWDYMVVELPVDLIIARLIKAVMSEN